MAKGSELLNYTMIRVMNATMLAVEPYAELQA